MLIFSIIPHIVDHTHACNLRTDQTNAGRYEPIFREGGRDHEVSLYILHDLVSQLDRSLDLFFSFPGKTVESLGLRVRKLSSANVFGDIL